MKKTLILIALNCFLWQNELFAAIQKAQLPLFFTPIDTVKEECVKISLKNGTIVYGKVSGMDATHLFFKSSDPKDALIKSILITTLSQVTDVHGKIIFKNEPQNILSKREKKGIFLANFSLRSVIASATALILWCILPKSLIIASNGFIFPVLTSLGNSLAFIFLGGLALGFIIGVISLMMLKRSKNKSAERKALIGIAPILLFFLFYFFVSIFGN